LWLLCPARERATKNIRDRRFSKKNMLFGVAEMGATTSVSGARRLLDESITSLPSQVRTESRISGNRNHPVNADSTVIGGSFQCREESTNFADAESGCRLAVN
jgi:hypothetical protein